MKDARYREFVLNTNDQKNEEVHYFKLQPICAADSGQLVELQVISTFKGCVEMSIEPSAGCWFDYPAQLRRVEAAKAYFEEVLVFFHEWISSDSPGKAGFKVGLPLTLETGLSGYFPEEVADLLGLYRVEPERVVFHFHESEFELACNEDVSNLIQKLSAAGFGISVDCFMASRGCLNILFNRDIHYIKCEKPLPKQAMCLDLGWRSLNNLVVLAKAINKKVIVSGIDTEDELRVIKRMGDVFFQGQMTGGSLEATKVILAM